MAEIVFLALARSDVGDIWQGIAADNRPAADRTVRRIVGRIETLADHPLIGPVRPQLGDGVRLLIQPPYVVPYRYDRGRITIIRVLHGARDLPEALLP